MAIKAASQKGLWQARGQYIRINLVLYSRTLSEGVKRKSQKISTIILERFSVIIWAYKPILFFLLIAFLKMFKETSCIATFSKVR
jgi:hypothetical protein